MKYTLFLFAMILVVTVSTGNAIEFKKTPIQTQLSQAITGSGLGLQTVATNVSNSENVNSDSSLSNADIRGHSVFKAGLYSLLVPGWGQYYNDKRAKGKVFFAAEAMTWITFISLRVYGGWKKDDMIRFGETRAGADLQGKDDDFHVLLELYNDIDEYNSLGRLVEPGSEYLPDNKSNHWCWQSLEDKATYRELREDYRGAYRRSKWVMLVALFDRVVAVVDAVRDARREEQADDGFYLSVAGKPLKVNVNPLADRSQIGITVYPGF
ncbi:MAG: DUF5683 domain-containing protein [candidate division Zixibacteria bacterium]|nr:DUF5683 domain-containing protein [candidate division Zixibacteria bacterium]